MFLELISLKNHIVLLALILLLLVFMPNNTGCEARECPNILILSSNNGFVTKVRNFTTNVSEVDEKAEVSIYLKPGSYVFRAERKLLKHFAQNETVSLIVINSRSNGFYDITARSSYDGNLSITEINSSMSIKNETINLRNYSFMMKTKNYREFLSYNLSIQFALHELNVSKPSLRTSDSGNEWSINLYIDHLTMNIEEVVKTELNILLPVTPLISDPSWRDMFINMLIENLTFKYRELGSYGYMIIEVYSSYVNIAIRGKSYVLNITPKTEVMLSNVEYVKLNTVNLSARFLENNSISVDFEVHGEGIGSSREVIIRNTLLNAKEISRKYGCFKLETIGVEIRVNNSKLNYVDENLVLNNLVVKENESSEKLNFAKSKLILYALILALAVMATSIIALLVKFKQLGFQAKLSKRT